jgi:hypothetical protein
MLCTVKMQGTETAAFLQVVGREARLPVMAMHDIGPPAARPCRSPVPSSAMRAAIQDRAAKRSGLSSQSSAIGAEIGRPLPPEEVVGLQHQQVDPRRPARQHTPRPAEQRVVRITSRVLPRAAMTCG